MVDKHKWHLFHLETWGRKVKRPCRRLQWNSPNNKVQCRVVIEINNFLNVTVSPIDGQTETDLYVKPRDSRQYLQSFSCHPYHCKKSIFDIHCNNLEKWVTERGYSEKIVRKEIVKAWILSRETLLDKRKNVKKLRRSYFYYYVLSSL